MTLASGGFLFAAEESRPERHVLSEASTLDEVVVIGKSSDLLGIAPSASEGVASGQELRARPLLRRGEVLETVPGMVVTQHAGGGKANQYFLRGFNLDHGTDFALTLDGMPLNMRTHAHGQGYADLNLLIPELLDRVDYYKGTYTARNGDLSSAGSADFQLYNVLPANFASLEIGQLGYYRAVAGNTFSTGSEPNAGKLTLAGEYNQ
jgi:outer membrane receptor protein involved in Fe transport